MRHALLTAGFIAGLVPSVIFLLLYLTRSAWRSTEAGRAVMALIVVTVLSYTTSVATLAAHDFFTTPSGEWVRIALRFAIAAVLWNLLRVLRNAQRTTTEEENTMAGSG